MTEARLAEIAQDLENADIGYIRKDLADSMDELITEVRLLRERLWVIWAVADGEGKVPIPILDAVDAYLRGAGLLTDAQVKSGGFSRSPSGA